MQEVINHLERYRRHRVTRYRLAVFLTLLFLIGFLLVRTIIRLNTPEGSNWYQLSLLITLIPMVFFAYAYMQVTLFKQQVQQELIPKILNQEFESVTYIKEARVGETWINESGLFSEYDKLNGENLVKGSYRSVHFEVSDLSVIYLRKSKNMHEEEKAEIKAFLGRFYGFHFENMSFEPSRFTQGKRYFDASDFKEFYTPDEAVNKAYKMYHQGDNVPTLFPNQLNLMRQLSTTYKQVSVVFSKHNIMVAVNHKRSPTQLSIKRKVTLERITPLIQDFQSIKEVIDILYSR